MSTPQGDYSRLPYLLPLLITPARLGGCTEKTHQVVQEPGAREEEVGKGQTCMWVQPGSPAAKSYDPK